MVDLTITLTPATVTGFCTINDVAEILQIAITDADKQASCARAINEATEAIRNYCNQYISEVEDDEITLDSEGGTKLFLPELPVTEVSEVVEDGEVLVEGSDEDYQLGEYGILHRVGGYNWQTGIQIITVTYTHGYATIPEDIKSVCARAASRIYQAGLKSAEHGGVPGVQSLGLGDYNVAYTSEAGGGVQDPVQGVSAARLLLLSEKDILNRYRVRRP